MPSFFISANHYLSLHIPPKSSGNKLQNKNTKKYSRLLAFPLVIN